MNVSNNDINYFLNIAWEINTEKGYKLDEDRLIYAVGICCDTFLCERVCNDDFVQRLQSILELMAEV